MISVTVRDARRVTAVVNQVIVSSDVEGLVMGATTITPEDAARLSAVSADKAAEEAFAATCSLRIPRAVEYPAPRARRYERFWRDPPDQDPGVKSGLALPGDSSWVTVLNPVFTLKPSSCLLTVTFSAQFTVPAGVGEYVGVTFRVSAQQGLVTQNFPGAADEFASFIARRTSGGDGLQIQSAYTGSLEVASGLSTDIKVQCQADVAGCYVLFAGLNMSY